MKLKAMKNNKVERADKKNSYADEAEATIVGFQVTSKY